MENTSLQLMTTNRLRDKMDMELGREQWEDFCKEEFGWHQGPSDPGAMYEAVRVCDDTTTIQKALDIAQRFSANPTATNDEEHPYVLTAQTGN